MKEARFAEGQNVAIEYRWSEGQYDQLPKLATELVRRQVAVIVAAGHDAAIAVTAATTTIPIVFAIGDDPVQMGIVALNRPEGNISGVSFYSGVLGAKGVELLHELVPTATAIGLLVNPNSPAAEAQAREAQAGTRALGQQLHIVNARNERAIDTGFAALKQSGVGALLISGNAEFTGQRDRLVALAARHSLPTMYPPRRVRRSRRSYELRRQHYGGVSADRRLHRAGSQGRQAVRPAGHAADQYEFVINLKTAKTLGLDIPAKLLALTDKVIE